MPTKFHIVTYGCQMNRYDSSALRRFLESREHIWTISPGDADFIVVNTCAVRQHAENRALGRLREFVGMKKKKPGLRVGIMGCVAQELGEKLNERLPGLDFIIGTDSLPIIAKIIEGEKACGTYIDVFPDFTGLQSPAHIETGQVSAFVTIMRGCNNYCSYCIVPYVRGCERSLPVKSIIEEIRRAVDCGVKEITLLGQNVNSYNTGSMNFPALLDKAANIEGIERIRFVTNHPKDFSQELIEVVKRYPGKIPPAFHLPLQSGSDRILEAMNRKYTIYKYMSIIERIYKEVPDAAISTDIITGFPGESDSDFIRTIDSMKKARFAGTFAFRYSTRPGTAAAGFDDDVPETIKKERLRKVIDLGIELAGKFSQNLVGAVQRTLVEGRAERNPGMLRTTAPSGRTVLIPDGSAEIGEIIPVAIEKAKTWVLLGKRLEE